MTPVRNRIEVMHGVNLDQLGRRDPAHYGGMSYDELEVRVSAAAEQLGLVTRFFQTNHEGAFVEHLHRLEGLADGIVLNPGAWTHYSYAIRDALELAALPAVEVHLSDVDRREPWRRESVIRDICIAHVAGKGPAGYREALERLRTELALLSARLASVRRELREAELDLVLVGDLVNVRYLTGYSGSNGIALIGPGTAEFVTDFRYVEQAAEEVDAAFGRHRGSQDLLQSLADLIPDGALKLGFEDDHITVRQHARLRELLPETVELVAAGGLVERLREVKQPREVASIRAASELADAAFIAVLGQGLIGRRERDVALALELAMRERGAEGPSFAPIVAAGSHGALPHAQPRDREIARGEVVVIDWGARLDGYCSDCTRTVAAGEPDGEAREAYGLVLQAQRAGVEGVRAGAGARDVDGLARAVIDAGGRGEQFGHGLGHGVGLDIHEAPRLAQTSEDVLRSGNVVTVEPGVYLPGRFGVRIEDLVVVADRGCEILTSVTKDLVVVE